MQADSLAFFLYAFPFSADVTHVSALPATLLQHLRWGGRAGPHGATAPRPQRSPCPPRQRRASSACPRSVQTQAPISTEPPPLFLEGKPQHAGHSPNCVEMIWYHGTSDSSVVFRLLLLLFFSPFGPVKGCKFRYPPIATSDFSVDIKPLKEYLLLDYKVLMPFNLKPDIFCGELWDLHFINENIKKLISVSGKSLAKLFMKIYNHTKFVEDCNIEVGNSSVNFELANISQFVDLIPFRLRSLSKKMENLTSEEKYADFQNCTIIQCQIEYSTLPIKTSVGKLEKQQSPQPVSIERSYWGLLLPILLVWLIFILWKIFQSSSSSII